MDKDEGQPERAAATSSHGTWDPPITACAHMTMPNGGTVTMEAPPGRDFDEALRNLRETHEHYIESGGWGGGR